MQRSFHHKLMKTYFAMHRQVMAEAKSLALTSGQPKILEFLSEREGVDQKTIAQNCEIESATVGSILERMEESGFIERRRENGNRRSLFVYLTPSGRSAAEQTEKIFSDAERVAFAGMSADEIGSLRRALDTVYQNLTEKGGNL